MGTAIVIVIIVVICVFAIYSYGHKMRHGGGCCGSHEAAEKKVKVADKNKDHYPYEVTLTIDGMTCSNCSRRVENALNRLDGVWAKVDLGERKADVRRITTPCATPYRMWAIRSCPFNNMSWSSALPTEDLFEIFFLFFRISSCFFS